MSVLSPVGPGFLRTTLLKPVDIKNNFCHAFAHWSYFCPLGPVQNKPKPSSTWQPFIPWKTSIKHISSKTSLVQANHPHCIRYSSEPVNFQSQLEAFCYCLSYSVLPTLRCDLTRDEHGVTVTLLVNDNDSYSWEIQTVLRQHCAQVRDESHYLWVFTMSRCCGVLCKQDERRSCVPAHSWGSPQGWEFWLKSPMGSTHSRYYSEGFLSLESLQS